MNATQKMNTVIYHAQNTSHRLIQWLATLLEDNKREGKTSIAVLDGVRAVAVILVLTYHINRVSGDNLWNMADYPLASSVSTAGSSGVLLFFVLSGFLLFLPYAKSLLFDSAWPSARSFYLRRAFRIIPASSWIPPKKRSVSSTVRTGHWLSNGSSTCSFPCWPAA